MDCASEEVAHVAWAAVAAVAAGPVAAASAASCRYPRHPLRLQQLQQGLPPVPQPGWAAGRAAEAPIRKVDAKWAAGPEAPRHSSNCS